MCERPSVSAESCFA